MNGSTAYLIILIPFWLAMNVGLFGIFKKAGEAGWKAFIPVYNQLIWLKITGRPTWWLVLLFVPLVSFVIRVGMQLDLVKSFNKQKFWEHALAVIFPFIYFPFLGFSPKESYIGPWAVVGKILGNEDLKRKIAQASAEDKPKLEKKLRDLSPHDKAVMEQHNLTLKDLRRKVTLPEKSEMREWMDAILFAGMVALLIRTFFLEAFMIPTSSMEGSLLAGDFLFVSKVHYGVRMPQAPLSIPFIHNKVPGTNIKSFSSLVKLPYARIPGFKEIERNDIVVFNYPADDIEIDPGSPSLIDITSMKQNYIKRCVALPGDTLQVKAGILWINGEPAYVPEHLQYDYTVISDIPLNMETMEEKYGFRTNQLDENVNFSPMQGLPNHYSGKMNAAKAAELKKDPHVTSIEPNYLPKDTLQVLVFPNRLDHLTPDGQFSYNPNVNLRENWNWDNFGPLLIPKKGMTIPLNRTTWNRYSRAIEGYEGHEISQRGTGFQIDGEPATEYTFEQNYYWLMGDNRHASFDSRFWGYVPEDHIIGRPWMVLISWENGPRFDRFFSPVTRWEP